jgi:hypothetical protein
MVRFIRLRRKSVRLLVVLGLCSALVVSGQAQNRAAQERCTGDVMLPLSVRVFPVETPHPGAALRVRVEVEAERPFAEVSLRVLAPPDVPVTAGQTRELGELVPQRPVQHEFTIVVPSHGQRRTVDVKVRAALDDGLTFEQGATLNLSFQDEPSRVVTDQSGNRVREVLARRIQ